MVEERARRGHEVVIDGVSIPSKQREMNAGVQLVFFLSDLRPQPMEQCTHT